jgi:predicted RNA binding protein YcfA (HicA-like mRNA interferase family)
MSIVDTKAFMRFYSVAFRRAVGIITTMNSRQLIKQLEADGWFLARVKGSHHQFKHPDSDIPAGTLNNIRKQAGWK